MKFKITFEITEKELAEALLPNGGKITDVEIGKTVARRARKSSSGDDSPKQTASRRKSAKA